MPSAAAILVSSIAIADARADGTTKAECLDAFTAGQHLKKDGRFSEARTKLLLCSRDPCPEGLHADCSQWLGELERSQPTIVPVVRGRTGAERADATIWIDGAVVARRLDGRALEVDPGRHVVRVEIPDEGPFESDILIHEGEKARSIVLSAPVTAARTQPEGRESEPVHGENDGARPVPWTVWAAGGVSIVALGVFGGFGIAGVSERSDLLATCNHSCTDAQKDSVDGKFVVADVALAVAVVAGLGATILYLTRP